MSAPVSKKTAIALAAALLCHATALAQLPSGGTVVGGAAAINAAGANQVITQTTPKAIINWQDFSIGAGNSVRINQPNTSSVILNRVTGNNPSHILGNLSANGQVFLVNPFGVYFGAGAVVDVGGLIATTLSIRNDDFMAGNYVFSREGLAARREVINAGLLKARDGGYIVLAGDYAGNSGVIQARLGTAALASGNKLTLDIAGDSMINFTVDEKAVADLSGVNNSGQLLADGGRAIMTAATARDLAATSVNNTGLVRAQSTVERNGEIYLMAEGGNAQVSGTLDASGSGAGQTGGRIAVLGERVALTGNARLDASGDAGGGTINVGGSYQGKGPLPNARSAYVARDVTIDASARNNGNGGDVVVWSDEYTRYYGDIAAKGGAQGGDGGNVEISGKAILDFNGTANTLAPKGNAGTLLLDPSDIEIVQSVDAATADMTGSEPFRDATDNGGTSRMSVGALETALAGGNVTVTTTTASGTAPKGGTITIDDGNGGGVQWNSGSTLRLQASNRIVINSHVEGYNGTIWLDAANGATQKSGTVIGANGLLLTGGGNWDLVGITSDNFVGSWNKVNTFAANISGGYVQFSNDKNLTIGTVNGVSGVTHANGNTQFYLDRNNGVLNLAQNVSTSSMYVRAQGGINQTAGALQVNNLALRNGSANLAMAGNNIRNISADINGDLVVNTQGSMTVGNPYGQAGIKTNNHNVTITTGDAAGFDPTKLPDGTNPASLTLNESIDAGTGTIRLTAGSGGVYQRHDVDAATSEPLDAGSLKAGNLLLQGASSSSVTPFVLNNAKNLVTTMAARTNGSISYTGGPLNIGSVGGVSGINTTANTIVTLAGVDAQGRATPAIYNDNNVSLSVGGNLNIFANINAATATGSGVVSVGVGGDYIAQTFLGSRINANTLGVFGDDLLGTFYLTTNVSALSAAGGKTMVINNSAYTGELTGLGIGAVAASATAPDVSGSGSTTVTSSSKPVGDFYLTTGGALNIIKLNSQGDNLLLRANSLNILLDAATKNGARIMLQPYNTAYRIGIENGTDTDFTADINYSAGLLKKFTNETATFFIGTPQNAILNDSNVNAAAKNIQTGDIHIGSDGALDLGYRSLSAQTTGSIVAHEVGPLYNLRLAATNLTIHSFKTFGPQMHFFTNNLTLPGTADKYQNLNKPQITFRTLNDETIWVGNSPKSWEPNFTAAEIMKMPDGSTIIISGSTDYPFPNGGAGYGDIHLPWDDTLGAALGNRKLVISTGNKVFTYSRTPTFTKKNDGGTSGGLWQGCQDLDTCKGENPNPFPDSSIDGGDNSGGGNGSGDGGVVVNPDSGSCVGCPPAPPNTNPYPPQTTTPGDDGGTGGTGTDGSGTSGSGSIGGGDGGGDGGGNGTGGGGTGDGDGGTGTGGAGDGGAGNGTGGGGTGDGTDGSGTGGTGDGTGTGGTGTGGTGDGTGTGGTGTGGGGTGDGDGGDGTGGAGDGGAGNGTGGGGAGDGTDGSGTGGTGDGTGTGGNGTGGGGTGDGDGGAGSGTGGTGDGGNGAGGGGTGEGTDGAGTGDTGDGTGNGGSGGNGSADGDGGAGTGSGGIGDGDGGNGNGAGNGGKGDGAGGADGVGVGDGDGNGGTTGAGDGSGDAGSGSASGGTGDGDSGSGTGGIGAGDGDASNGAGAGGDNAGDAGSSTKGGDLGDDNGSGNGSHDENGASATAPAAFDLNCADVSAAAVNDAVRDDDKADAKNRLIQVNREGLRMDDPCQKPQAQSGPASLDGK
ncbi:filamentous hemagglutinin family protein [Paucimonas lemoignei]|uniref:Filamentous hemagglutinin family protein n=1 Tax=Paucimonas lemoignei TaxID=29443 RepID=A0A4R3HXH7_PAULE|nr:filamentous hemagglutinin N-terminal domain-containing protein [Paucimonas lemoignei]TCS37534.1 filamentous hemagglutinin family protein [Paucimonas lemoignei]